MQYDCQTCGACCYGPEDYVTVVSTDRLKMSAQVQSRYVEQRGDRAWLKMVHGHCSALRARQGHFSCRIYGQRPAVCHVVKEGSRECLAARKKRGIDAGA